LLLSDEAGSVAWIKGGLLPGDEADSRRPVVALAPVAGRQLPLHEKGGQASRSLRGDVI
jgi:hypothetical protein